jgi:DNA polymerase-4
VRLLGLGVSGLSDHVQEDLFADVTGEGGAPGSPVRDAAGAGATAVAVPPDAPLPVPTAPAAPASVAVPTPAPLAALSPLQPGWRPGQDVTHREHGPGWVWGSGRGLVTIRFEGPATPPGPVRTFAVDDPALEPADPPFHPAGADEAP